MKRVERVVTRDTGRDITDLLNCATEEQGLDAVGFLGGAIAESRLDEHAARERAWPDVSFGLWQPTVKWLGREVAGLQRAADGTALDTPANRQVARAFCWDAERLTAYVAPHYAALLRKWSTPLEAWCRWNKPNMPGSENPNRAKYVAGLRDAEAHLAREEHNLHGQQPTSGEAPERADPANGFAIGQGFLEFLLQHPEWGKARMNELPMEGGSYLWTTPTPQHPKGSLLIYRKWLNAVRPVAWE